MACRILAQNGFDCYNLSGGYQLYQSIFGRGAVHQNEMINPKPSCPKTFLIMERIIDRN